MLHNRRHYVVAIAAVLGALLAFASSAAAAAAPSGNPVRFWKLGRFEYGSGAVTVSSDAQPEGTLQRSIQVGPAAFDLQPPFPYSSFLPPRDASGSLFSSADGNQYSVLAQAPPLNDRRLGAPKGTFSDLDEYEAYVKRTRKASLQITLSDLLLRTIDTNPQPGLDECPRPDCTPIVTFVSFQARAYAASAGGDFFHVGGAVYLEGHKHFWRQDPSTLTGSTRALWNQKSFTVDPDTHHDGSGDSAVKRLSGSITVNVPLTRVHRGELFAVHVSLVAQAIDDRGGESGAQAFIQDPQHVGPGLDARGLERRGAPRFKEPALTPRPAASCPGGANPHAGTVQLRHPAFTVGEGSGIPMVLVTRTGGSRGATSVIVTTSGGTARSGQDFKPTRTLVRFENGDTSPRLVEIPILEDRTIEQPEDFTVSLSGVRCAKFGGQRSADVTILDDDQPPPPPPPPPTFTIGGTVDGLRGSGLVLSDLGGVLPVSANGSFTLPGTHIPGESYQVTVSTQPHNPDQVCTVDHGTGQVRAANVTDVAVHCATIATPSGLDTTFGSAGRVSTPVGGLGQGEAVVIQPGDKIVTAGWRTVGTGIATDYALTRHNPDGTLDTSFGTNGIATTDLGGPGDKAFDAALLPDGGIFAVGRTDAAGALKSQFGIARYRPDGTLDPGFGSGGIVTTAFFAKGAQANAVGVQPDGKIVVGGFAVSANGVGSDFALARYNPDGTLDTSFGVGGTVTTDFGALSDDDVNGLVIGPDGTIVAAGVAGEDIALARYTPGGQLDPTFGSGGTRTTDLGFVDVANGVALTPDGGIVVAGYTVGTKLNNDFLLVRYGPDGGLDRGFGTLGVVKTDFGAGEDFAENLVVDAAGRIVVVGRATSSTILDMALARYNPDGRLDTSFATNGTLTVDFHGRGEFGQDVALDSAGRIVAVGSTPNGGDTQFALMRANP